MKKSNIIAGAAALVAVIGISGLAFSSFAADSDTAVNTANRGRGLMGQANLMGIELTDEQKAQLEAKRTEMETEREARRTEMEAAMDKGYEAWVAQIKEEFGDEAPVLDTINASNFDRYKEGHNLMEQGRAIMEELGVEGNGLRMGKGMGKGGRGHGGMGGGTCPMMDASAN